MENEFLDTEPILYLTGYYDEDNPVDKDELTEIYCVVYKVDKQILGVEPKELYTFTTKFQQAFKRFKIFPTGYAVIKRFLTDDENLVKLAVQGTTEEWKEEDITEELNEKLKNLKYSDLYGDIVVNSHLNEKSDNKVNSIPVTYTINKPFEEPNITTVTE